MNDRIFLWEGTDSQGTRLSGELSESSAMLARVRLRSQGLRALSVRRKPRALFSVTRRVAPRDIAHFTRQMAVMLKAGVPLLQALGVVGECFGKSAMNKMVQALQKEIAGGNSFSGALQKWPKHFDGVYCNLVVAGEQSGTLDVLMETLAVYKERGERLRGRVRRAMAYPLVVIVMALLVASLLLIEVVPQFEAVFADFGAQLPAFTLFVVGLSDGLRQNGYLILALFILSGFTYGYLYGHVTSVRHMQERFSLKAPILGAILRKVAMARYARTLATTFAAGVPLVDSLVSVAGATGNVVFRSAVDGVRADVASGQQLHQAMRHAGVFPAMMVQMVAIGEEAGALDEMLGRAATIYESEVDDAVDNLTTLMEPAIMAVLGILVGGLIVAMYLPIFQLGNVIG